MASDQVVNVSIIGDFKKLTKATQGAEGQLKALNKRVGKFSSAMKASLAGIAAGFTLGAVVNGFKDALTQASETEQQFGALDSIFKQGSGELKAFAGEMEFYGLSTADAARNMALLGSLLKGTGMPMDEVSKRTQKLTALAADMAATFGGTTSDAVASISSLLKGEYNPIEKYGVSLRKSVITDRIATWSRDRLNGKTQALLESEAAYEILLEKTADAQGQASREADTYNGRLQRMDAQFKNIQAKVGEELLPILNDVSDWMGSTEGKQFIEDAIEAFKDAIVVAKEFFGWLRDIRDIFNSEGGKKAQNAMFEFYGGKSPDIGLSNKGVAPKTVQEAMADMNGANLKGGGLTYNTFNVQVEIAKTNQPAEEIVRQVKKLEANNGRKYLFR